jgi:hypothetical protein
MKDLAAATGIPYEIIFGREGGSSESGKEGGNAFTALQLYDNFIDEHRVSEANPIIDKLLPVLCMSAFGEIPEDLSYHWNPIRAISDKERSDLGKSLVESILMAYNADLVTKKEARKELAQQSGTNGLFSSITEESIADTPDTYASETYANIGMEEPGMEGEEGIVRLPNREEEKREVETGETPAEQRGMKPPPPTSGLGTDPKTQHKPVSSPAGGAGNDPKKKSSPSTKLGFREGEMVPIESKPIGVKSLLWHKSKRIVNPEEMMQHEPKALGSGGKVGGVGGQAHGTAKSIEQGLEHSQKHTMKRPQRTKQ